MFVSAAWIVPAVLGAVNVVAQRRLHGGDAPLTAEVLFVFGDWLLYGFLTPGVFVLSRRFPLARPRLVPHVFVHLGLSLLFCVAWAGGGAVLRAVLMPEMLWNDVGTHVVSWLFITLPFGVMVYLAVVGIEHAVRYFADVREREMQMARLGAQLSEARFAALQAQLNPHFLFNALNTIAVRVRDGEADAARMVEQLSDVLRRILDRHRVHEVTLGEELELVRQYLAIEQARFSDRLRPVFDVPSDTLSGAVPSFAVQHLVENAVRHGISRKTASGVIRLAVRRVGDGGGESLEITVSDDGAGIGDGIGDGLGDDTETPGHGLANTRERLRVLYAGRASLSVTPAPDGGTVAELRVPWRELPVEPDHAEP